MTVTNRHSRRTWSRFSSVYPRPSRVSPSKVDRLSIHIRPQNDHVANGNFVPFLSVIRGLLCSHVKTIRGVIGFIVSVVICGHLLSLSNGSLILIIFRIRINQAPSSLRLLVDLLVGLPEVVPVFRNQILGVSFLGPESGVWLVNSRTTIELENDTLLSETSLQNTIESDEDLLGIP